MVPISVFRSRRPLRSKTSSKAEDFSIFRSQRLLSLRSRRLLSLKSRRPLSLQEPEDVFDNQRLLNLQGLKISPTHCTFLTKYIVISCIDVDLIWRSDKVSFVYYTILRKGLYHPSAGQHFKPKHLKTKGTSCTLLKTGVHPLLNRCPIHLMHEAL
ncbi:hypothetical protein L6452_14347 [Arctium lappa]|uniref:Uncharacterized protein n=1 Tax=Arctium lappa TaxID=4217 RepID=A0ACB9CKR6_ARCLA|nr:hypothetical protein L6452_14347 [Arctium lappa]